MTDERPLTDRTRAVVVGRPVGEGEPLNQPLVLASNFRSGPEYARTHGTDTWRALEEAVGALERAECVSFASGMAAASAIVFALRPSVVILPTVSYLGVRALLSDLAGMGTLRTVAVDITDPVGVETVLRQEVGAVDPGRVLLWVESPTNPTLDEADIATLSSSARRLGVRTVVDSTFATPIGARPLESGADVVLHSGTKFIGGHSDLLIGLVCASDPSILESLRHARVVQGATPGSLEAFLALRGLRTLPLRYAAASESAGVLADRLSGHPAVEWVRRVGPMVSFIVRGGADVADTVCASVRLIVPATSLGGVETTMERRQKYAGDSHVDPGLIRMSVGIEDVDDLWDDLERALDVTNAGPGGEPLA